MPAEASRTDNVLRERSGRRLVLVVDDDDALRGALAEWLEEEGFEVAAAANGLEALDRLREGLRPCLVLLDLMMPVMDGWDFRREQMNDSALRDIPVIIVTAAGFSPETVKAQLGAVELMPKPWAPGALFDAVRSRCGDPTPPSV